MVAERRAGAAAREHARRAPAGPERARAAAAGRDAAGRGGRAALRTGGGAAGLLASWEASTGAAASGLLEHQLAVVYVEAECGLLAMGGRVFRREERRGAWAGSRGGAPSRSMRELTPAEVDAACPADPR